MLKPESAVVAIILAMAGAPILFGCSESGQRTASAGTAAVVVGDETLVKEREWIEQMGWVKVSQGEFDMGSPPTEPGRFGNESPVRRVKITRPFAIGRYEVTQRQWNRVMGTDSENYCGEDCPVKSVSWWDSLQFANQLSLLAQVEPCYELKKCDGQGGCDAVKFKGLSCTGYRLPTEAEWEYAARAGTATAIHNGPLPIPAGTDDLRVIFKSPELDFIAWYLGNRHNVGFEKVGKKSPNGWGLHDMIGNVYEWVWDWEAAYDAADAVDPLGPPSGSKRVIRGGSWSSGARWCRSAHRTAISPLYRQATVGVRLARTTP